MFGLLNTTQIYGIQQQTQQQQHSSELYQPSILSLPDSNKSPIVSCKLFSRHSTTSFLEKFLKSDFSGAYDTIKNYKHFHYNHSTPAKRHSEPSQADSILTSFNCLQGSYRHSFDSDIYENYNSELKTSHYKGVAALTADEMTIKCSKNLLAVEPEVQGPATLQNYQKIPEAYHDAAGDILVPSSGASSGEFNCNSDATTASSMSSLSHSSSNNAMRSSSSGTNSTNSSTNLYKRLSFGGRNINKSDKNTDNVQRQAEDVTSDNSSSTALTTATLTSRSFLTITSLKYNDLQRRSSSSSSGAYLAKRDRRKGAMTPQPEKTPSAQVLSTTSPLACSSSTQFSTEEIERRKLMIMVSSYEQQNKLLQRELAKEKRRRTEELARVLKSLLCFESKLKADIKSANQKLLEKDKKICALLRQNQSLRKHFIKLQELENTRDEGVVEDDVEQSNIAEVMSDEQKMLEDYLVLEALQCINCRKQFYDIEVTECGTQTQGSQKEGVNRSNDDPTTEQGSSSDDTVSSSFFGARRSVRYTSKRTSGTFRDYMRSRSMDIDDPALRCDFNSEECFSTISHNDSNVGYEKLPLYSRTMERLHGVRNESERDSEHSGMETSTTRSLSRASSKSISASSKASELSNLLDNDDGIFSPTQDGDFEEVFDDVKKGSIITSNSNFSEASPKQIYETSTDDWYASASDQDEIAGTIVSKSSYNQGAINPVLECVNQILLQQSMEGIEEHRQTIKANATLPRRSSLSDRHNSRCNSQNSDGNLSSSRNGMLTRKRVHFSTKNSIYIPRNDELDEKTYAEDMISNYQGIADYIAHSPPLREQDEEQEQNSNSNNTNERLDALNYESIYSNEYEPIGSEVNSSNLYVDMETTVKSCSSEDTIVDRENLRNCQKLPPALPPKPANLIRFKKCLQQLDESPDELSETHATVVEPDYCSISEVNVGITSVQIRADVHRVPLSDQDIDSLTEVDVETSTVMSDNASQKTEEIEEIFADIPKLPNVAAIIAPKSAITALSKQNDYLVMSPMVKDHLSTPPKPTTAKTNLKQDKLSLSSTSLDQTGIKSPITSNTLSMGPQYKRKQIPNILAEINKRLSLPNLHATSNSNVSTPNGDLLKSKILFSKTANEVTDLPLQAEFDWYNLDAEYGKPAQMELIKVNEAINPVIMPSLLAEIQEDGESVTTTADEYNLDEEFGQDLDQYVKTENINATRQSNEIINASKTLLTNTKAKKIKKNLANFEKFIETTGLISKPLSTKKIYFAGPFV
ncbi:uncharacterized protein LOC119640256 [Glossina fuscipes]|uniref:Uncharacterized protein LOC119640256 n=1 Tax=Glossina fuscipes TaxID=7396 RepID=A0A9C6DW99_9MUSC|nr:uncharacterized protein LOC119640256 [Glossina fuscipes]KAI9578956.1 hypothetical protein GQX74_005839 [Glossina fuscipes]